MNQPEQNQVPVANSQLVLHVRKVYFDQIKSGEKKFEYRERTPYWEKRLRGKSFQRIVICAGYPTLGEYDRIITRPWKGFQEARIIHPHFGPRMVDVFAVVVNEIEL